MECLRTFGLSTRAEDLADFDEATILALYKKLALKRHPDKHGGNAAAQEAFKKLESSRVVFVHHRYWSTSC